MQRKWTENAEEENIEIDYIQPERNLIAAIVQQAMDDLRHLHEREGAIAWFRDDKSTLRDIGSFVWCIHNLGYDVGDVYGKMLKLIKKTENMPFIFS